MTVYRRRIAALLALALAPVAWTGGDSAAAPQSRPLEEGTDLVLLEDHRVPLVYLVIEFPVGSWSPWARKNHAEEAFTIQLHDPENRLRARADELGLAFTLVVEPWSSRIEISCLREDLEAALALVRDLFANRSFDRDELKRWKKERSLNWAISRKNPQFVLAQAQARLLFSPGDPRRRSWEKPPEPWADAERLAAVRDAMVRLPGRVIGLAGDLSRDQAQRAAAGLLPPVTERPPAGLKPTLPALSAGGRKDRVIPLRGINQVYFAYVRPSLDYRDEDWPAFMVADHVLGGHFYSRLYVALRHHGGETYGASTTNQGGVAVGSYALTTYTRSSNAGTAERKLREVLSRFCADGITDEERRDAIGFLRGRGLLAEQAPEQILGRILGERRHGFPSGLRDRLVERAAELSLEEINAFIRRFYDPAGFVMIQVVPES
ncbi:MAG: insulinase family protein [bacterium]|nr:insulinase family protein [bacterium]